MLRDGEFLTSDAPGSSATVIQRRMHLLDHLGLTPWDAKSANKAGVLAFVHDLRYYGYDSSFGPYMPDGSGRINWAQVHAIHRAIAMHLVDLNEDEPFVFPLIPTSISYFQSAIAPGMDLARERDWAVVEEMWHVAYSVCRLRMPCDFVTIYYTGLALGDHREK